MRPPIHLGAYSTYNLAWVQHYHPGWILYRPDTKTSAWLFCQNLDVTDCDGAYTGIGNTPLDVSQAAVQTFESTDVKYALASGNFGGNRCR